MAERMLFELGVAEGLANATGDIVAAAERIADRCNRPWLYPDRNPMPCFVLFPRVTRLASCCQRLIEHTFHVELGGSR